MEPALCVGGRRPRRRAASRAVGTVDTHHRPLDRGLRAPGHDGAHHLDASDQLDRHVGRLAGLQRDVLRRAIGPGLVAPAIVDEYVHGPLVEVLEGESALVIGDGIPGGVARGRLVEIALALLVPDPHPCDVHPGQPRHDAARDPGGRGRHQPGRRPGLSGDETLPVQDLFDRTGTRRHLAPQRAAVGGGDREPQPRVRRNRPKLEYPARVGGGDEQTLHGTAVDHLPANLGDAHGEARRRPVLHLPGVRHYLDPNGRPHQRTPQIVDEHSGERGGLFEAQRENARIHEFLHRP